MSKHLLLELAQKHSYNLPSYCSVKEGPDHAPRFKSSVSFNGEVFESPGLFSTLRQAENAAAQMALQTLSKRGPTQLLASQLLDEQHGCKSILQEAAQRAGIEMPSYSVERSGPSHLPLFVCSVKVAGMSFAGKSAKTKKEAEKNAATAAWTSLKNFATRGASSTTSNSSNFQATERQLQAAIVRILMNQQCSTVLTKEGSPLRSPLSPSCIKITSLKDQSSQGVGDVCYSSSATSYDVMSDNKDSIPLRILKDDECSSDLTKEGSQLRSPVLPSCIKITPCKDQSSQVDSNVSCSSSATSHEAMSDNKDRIRLQKLKNEECGAFLTKEGSPLRSLVLPSHIKIIPFKDQSSQGVGDVFRSSSATSHELMSDNKDSIPLRILKDEECSTVLTKEGSPIRSPLLPSRIKITPLKDQSSQGVGDVCYSSSATSYDVMADNKDSIPLRILKDEECSSDLTKKDLSSEAQSYRLASKLYLVKINLLK